MSDIDSLFSCFNENISATCSNDAKAEAKDSQQGAPITTVGKRKRNEVHDRTVKGKKLMYNPLQDPDINMSELDPGVNVHTITRDEDCLHEVAVPPNQKFPNLIASREPPARTYKFDLDTFQKKAIMCVENNHSVLVSAHTSAGKTVIAEYAIALALESKQRVIYTTPIKALSNQKYREMLQEFKDVGIMTGDVTIDPMASCLVMTTEILRSMLLRGSEVTKEVGWVIFDEIHYMRDKKRGVVWEETIILLPDNVRYVFLSATIPNARQFAEWISHLHQQPCHVVYTEYRPTPLQHYLFPADSNEMYLVLDEKGKLMRDNFDKAMTNLDSQSLPSKTLQKDENGKKAQMMDSDHIKYVINVVKVLMRDNLAPLIIFSFKKSSCETFAMHLSKLNFNTVKEQRLVEEVFSNAIGVLSDDEKELPQITKLLPLLKKGIAFHHSGLLPLMKEVVEILFGEGLIKALFATETFAMGLNMPAKTVVFTSISKFDGVDVRNITSGEYIQMSGRAGRRGLDTNGLVVMMMHEKISPSVVSQIITGKAAPLHSAFHLTYNMILNLMRQEEINPQYMINKSFLIFQSNARLMELRRTLKTKQKKYTSIHINNEENVASYSETTKELESVHDQIQQQFLEKGRVTKFLTPGRLVKVKTEEFLYDWGVIVENNGSANLPVFKILLHVQADGTGDILPKPDFSKKKGRVAVFPVDYRYVYQVCSVWANVNLNNKPKLLAKAFLKRISELKALYPYGFPLFNPVTDMGINNPVLDNLIRQVQCLENSLSHSPIFNQNCETILRNFRRKEELSEEICEILDDIKKLQSLIQMEELQRRKDVLKQLGYCNEIEVITMKGRVACEMSCVDELLISEMIFNGIFNELSVDYCVALLSGFICDEKFIPDDLSYDRNIYRAMKLTEEVASAIANVAVECKLITSKEEYVSKCFQSHLVEVVLAWCRGASFLDICKMTSIYEGSIIRYLRILEEVLRQVCRAATNVGNIDLENRFSEGIRILKHGVVFAGSLYL